VVIRSSNRLPTAGWPEGHYLLRLDSGAASRYVPLTVRSADTRGRLLVLTSPMTWQAYNGWGGGSLYGPTPRRPQTVRRSAAVSFDRPYDDGYGAGALLSLGKLMVGVYVTCGLFIFVVLGAVARATGFSLLRFLKYIGLLELDTHRHWIGIRKSIVRFRHSLVGIIHRRLTDVPTLYPAFYPAA